MENPRTRISGTGSYIPTLKVTNEEFNKHEFYNADGSKFANPNSEIIEKFKAITGIKERRYASKELNTSDIAAIAAKLAIEDAGIDPETIDQIIFAHNFGDVSHGSNQTDAVPSLGNRVKHHLGIKNPYCIAYDLFFGCPGWIQGLITADALIKSGQAKRCLVIGAETLSRVVDPSDRDAMIFSDGAGAAIVEATTDESNEGVLASSALSHSLEELDFLFMGKSFDPENKSNVKYIKMLGRKIYEYTLTYVPQAMLDCLIKANIPIEDVKKVFIHQANEKMDEAIIKRMYKGKVMPKDIMPMSIHWLGNSSVATVITLFDLVRKGKLDQHKLNKGDIILFASVGAGMNINAVVYRY
ncbi:3-oxoacyl-ACP synthase III family protein [Peijinzhouia sedimentorum]